MANKFMHQTPSALHNIRQWLSNGLDNPLGIDGKVSWIIENKPGDHKQIWSCLIDLRSCHIHNWLNGMPEQKADAVICMSLDVAEKISREIHTIDYRDPSIMERTRISGNLALVNHVAKALLTPGMDAKERLSWATQRKIQSYATTMLERIHQPTELEILRRIANGEPFIATGMAPPGSEGAWTLERLNERYGPVPLRVRSADQKENVSEFIERVQAALKGQTNGPIIEGFTKAYSEGCLLPQPMRADFMPHRFTLDDYVDPQIWLGAVPVDVPASSLHRDPLDGFLFQLIGRKKLILYSPDQEPLLYPMKAWNNYQPCWVSPEAPRLDIFPRFAQAKSLEIILNPGELLIQPAGWFHAVYCLESPTFSVSYFLRH